MYCNDAQIISILYFLSNSSFGNLNQRKYEKASLILVFVLDVALQNKLSYAIAEKKREGHTYVCAQSKFHFHFVLVYCDARAYHAKPNFARLAKKVIA